jgi:aryl-alcohol dehydrogenase-like predicted oxidoreductase
MTRIDGTELEVFPLCLGGNVFGWTADERQSFDTLDAFADAGGNFVDTADAYSAWVPGHSGGESETIIGRWMASRKARQRVIVATKVGATPALKGLSPQTVKSAAEASLRRLGVDRIDLYYAHIDDAETPLEETLQAFDSLIREGKVRYIGASNYAPARLEQALAISKREGIARYVALQPHYNLVHRQDYEGDLMAICRREGISCLPYFGLAKGFLTGKYRPGAQVESVRAGAARAYLDERGLQLLSVLDDIAAAHATTVAAVSLAWLAAQPTIASVIASARTPEQVADLLPMANLTLSGDELARLQAN